MTVNLDFNRMTQLLEVEDFNSYYFKFIHLDPVLDLVLNLFAIFYQDNNERLHSQLSKG